MIVTTTTTTKQYLINQSKQLKSTFDEQRFNEFHIDFNQYKFPYEHVCRKRHHK